MLHPLASRWVQPARTFLRASHAFPRNPIFLSFTPRHLSVSSRSLKDTTPSNSPDQNPTVASTDSSSPESPPQTNLEHSLAAVSCTVSPPATFAFLKPTPVVLLTGPFGGNWCYRDTWQTSLADQGYQSTSIELSMPETKLESGDAYVRHFVKILKKSIETDHSFYPPIMIAHGLHALVAQKYVESNPVSALVLVSPFIPEIIQDRFQTLSQKLALGNKIPVSSAGSEADQQETEGSLGTETDKQEQQQEFYFETHADVTAQQGFRARYILPAQAEYEIDRVAKALQDKREQTEKETSTDTEDHAHLRKELHAPETLNQENTHQDSQNKSNSDNEPAADPNEALGKDSLPVLDENESKLSSTMTTDATTGTDIQADDESMPVQTVGSEASVHSPLERLPLSIYDSIPPSLFEPTFPILLVTSDGDQVVSTKDVKEHHRLSGEVDHIELEDRGKSGGHLIMCPDNAEWEEGIQGITAWLDSNGM